MTLQTNAIQIERAVHEHQLEVQQTPSETLPQTQLKKVEKPAPEPQPVTPAEILPLQKAALATKPSPSTRPKPKQPIAQPPQFIKPLSPVKVTEGKPVTLEVEFEGFPPPQITWFRESFEIHPSPDFQVCFITLYHTFPLSERSGFIILSDVWF